MSHTTIGDFQYKTPSTALQKLRVLRFLSCFKVANTRCCWIFCFSEKLSCGCSQIGTSAHTRMCLHTNLHSHSPHHPLVDDLEAADQIYHMSKITAANSMLTMQNLMSFQQMRVLFLGLYVETKHFLFVSK